MQCSPGSCSLRLAQDGPELRAFLQGTLGDPAIALLTQLADRIRAADGPMRVRLDITEVHTILESGLAGVLAIEQAAAERDAVFEIRASGPQAAEKLAQAGLAHLLYSGP